ncbi:MAG: hypothetical protein E2591_29770 [Achromobacter sp.]|uniref:hypothetical protein n=1 Tax=Achromobacter sp. TaxID=134375 RepID=UPI0012CFBC5D|nr:hypothetical protein [Achromobacter sp.]
MRPSEQALYAVKDKFYDEGISVMDWARAHGFDAHLIYRTLSGRSRATEVKGIGLRWL